MKYTDQISSRMLAIDDLLKNWRDEVYIPKVLGSICETLNSADAVILYSYQAVNATLIVEDSRGVECDINGLYPLQINDSLCGRVFLSCEGRLINDARELDELSSEITGLVDLIHLVDRNHSRFPTSMIVIPVLVNEKPWGVLQLMTFSLCLGFSHADYDFCQCIADLLSLHISWEQAQNSIMQLEAECALLNNVVSIDEDENKFSLVLSRSMMDLFLRGKDFVDVMALAAHYIDFPMALFNMFFERISGTANSINMELPDTILGSDQLQQLMQWKTPQVIEVPDHQFVYLYPVRNGEILSGFIAVWLAGNRLTNKQKIVVDHTGCCCSCIWVKLAAINNANQYLKSEVLTGLLSGRQDDDFLNRSRALGLNNENMFFVVQIAVQGIEDHINYSGKFAGGQLINYLQMYMKKKGLKGIIIPESNHICIISSYNDLNRKNNRYDNIVSDVMSEIYDNNPQLLISGGRIYQGIFNIRKSYWEAGQCMIIINKYFIHRKVVNYGDVGVLRLLLTQKKEDVESYLDDILGPILAYDKRKKADLMTTLFYYSRLNKSMGYISAKLNIHPNTLYQRIKKAEELMGYDFENPMDWFDVQAASIMYGLIYTDLITKL